jgi:hypothetical protein
MALAFGVISEPGSFAAPLWQASIIDTILLDLHDFMSFARLESENPSTIGSSGSTCGVAR